MEKKAWTQKEVDFIKRHRFSTNAYLAKKLGRSIESVKGKKHALTIDSELTPMLPEKLTQQEKEIRIVKLAADMRVKLKGWE